MYPQLCFQYIRQNPVRAGLATTLDEWPCSSYQDYAGLRNGSLCNQAAGRVVLDLPTDAGGFIGQSEKMVDPKLVRKRWL